MVNSFISLLFISLKIYCIEKPDVSQYKIHLRWFACFLLSSLFLQMISDFKALRRAFKKLDQLGDGFVSVTDFKVAMSRFSFPLNEEDFFHIFSVFDENMEGKISYVDFMRRSLSE